MSDEKLDLILTVVSDIKVKVDNLGIEADSLETGFDRLEVKVDSSEAGFDGLKTKVDNLDSEVKGPNQQVSEAFANVNNRFTLLEKQMLAIGAEIKEEIRRETKAVGARIDRLEKQIIYDRNETLEN